MEDEIDIEYDGRPPARKSNVQGAAIIYLKKIRHGESITGPGGSTMTFQAQKYFQISTIDHKHTSLQPIVKNRKKKGRILLTQSSLSLILNDIFTQYPFPKLK